MELFRAIVKLSRTMFLLLDTQYIQISICLLIYSGKIYAQFSDFNKWKCKWFRKMSLDFVTAGDQKDVINLFDVPAIPTCRILISNIWYLSFFCIYFVEVSNVYTHVLSFQPQQLFTSIKISWFFIGFIEYPCQHLKESPLLVKLSLIKDSAIATSTLQ